MEEDIFAVSDEEQLHESILSTPPVAAVAARSPSKDSQPDSSLKRKADSHTCGAPASNKKHHSAGQGLCAHFPVLHLC